MKRYFVLAPGWVYALNFYGRNEREARAAAREWLGLKRLPAGTAVWLGQDKLYEFTEYYSQVEV